MKRSAVSVLVCCGLALAPSIARPQAPLVVDERPARTREDGHCWDNANRFVECGNGTVTDTVTGLVWLRDASCDDLAAMGGSNVGAWPTAMESAAALADGLCGLSDGSEPGDWRLPTREEWESTLARAIGLGCTGASAPAWTNDAGTACLSSPPTSFVGVMAASYWSSTVDPASTAFADVANLSTGSTNGDVAKISNAGFWAVRETFLRRIY